MSNKMPILVLVALLLLTTIYSSDGYGWSKANHIVFDGTHYRNKDIFNKPKRCIHFCEYKTRTTPTKISMTIDPITILNEFDYGENWLSIVGMASIAGAFLSIPPSRLISTTDLYTITADTYLERKKNQLQCVYKASKDGWSAIAFHNAVDNMGSGIVVARTVTGTTFGGYNPNGWRSTDDYYSSSSAFLWCYNNSRKIIKLPILPGGNCAIFDYATSGPCFGAADLLIGPPQAAIMGGFAGPDAEDISKSAGSLRQCKSAIGSTYDSDKGWPIRGSARLSEVEVYCLPNAK
jgi:hypothetical protein